MQAGNKMTFHNDNFNTCLLETENVWGSSASAWNLFCPGAGAKNKQTTKTTKPNKETVEPDALYLSLCNKGGHFEGCK